jgi:hypothetical protein
MTVALIALALGGSPSANLSIRVWPQGTTHAARVWTLRCNPVGGTLPRAGTACRRLAAFSGNPFAATRPGSVCTQIYGGPQVARVRGSFHGRRVSATFTRRDGCAIHRWDRVSFLFPVRL